MDENQKYEIAVLAEDYENKCIRLENLSMVNTAGKTAEERVKMSIDYHLAQAELSEAWRKLNSAKYRVAP